MFVFCILSFILPRVFAYQCFSEYEFTWFDGQGEEHVNLVSISHFQNKIGQYYLNNRRPPLKEAFFFIRLDASYQRDLMQDCPFVFVIANLLVANFHIHDNLPYSDTLFQRAMEVFQASYAIQQEVTLQTWHLAAAIDRFSAERRAVIEHMRSESTSRMNLTLAIFATAEPSDEILAHLKRYFTDSTQVVIFTPGNFSSESLTVRNAGSRQEAFLEISREAGVSDLLFIHDEGKAEYKDRDLSLPLTIHLLKILAAGNRHILPDVFPLSRRLSPAGISDSTVHGVHYSQSQVFVKAEVSRSLGISDLAFRSENRTRCDDQSLPLALRLCLGDEHWRGDWRSVHLAPVYPRRAITQID